MFKKEFGIKGKIEGIKAKNKVAAKEMSLETSQSIAWFCNTKDKFQSQSTVLITVS